MHFDDVTNIIEKMTAPMRRRISLMVGRAVISAAVDDSTTFQTVQLDALAGETLEGLERFQNYGFTGVPKAGAEAVVIFPQGNRDHGLVICVDDREYRLKGLDNGEVAMYTDEGDKIHIKRGGEIVVAGASKVHIDSPAIELGSVAAEAVIKGNTFQALFNAHTHVGNAGYNTSPPAPLLTGAELSTVSKTQ